MEILNLSDETRRRVRNYYQVDNEIIQRDLIILRNWIKQQKHLPQSSLTGDNFLEGCLLRNKFRIEQTKTKIDNYFTIRGNHKEYLLENNKNILPSNETTLFCPFPKLTQKQERLILFKLNNFDPELYDFSRIIIISAMFSELLLRNDYTLGERFLIDLNGITMDHIKKVSISELMVVIPMYRDVFSGRISGIDIINTPSFINLILGIIRSVLPTKLYDRVRIHDDLESLHKSIPKSILPKNYEGDDTSSVDDIMSKWDKIFKANYSFFDENYNNVSNEKFRLGKTHSKEIFGFDGTFKKLNID